MKRFDPELEREQHCRSHIAVVISGVSIKCGGLVGVSWEEKDAIRDRKLAPPRPGWPRTALGLARIFLSSLQDPHDDLDDDDDGHDDDDDDDDRHRSCLCLAAAPPAAYTLLSNRPPPSSSSS